MVENWLKLCSAVSSIHTRSEDVPLVPENRDDQNIELDYDSDEDDDERQFLLMIGAMRGLEREYGERAAMFNRIMMACIFISRETR